jgi:uncharacterized protein
VEPRIVNISGLTIELRVDAEFAPSALRAFAGLTPIDAKIDALPVPQRPAWLRACVRLLRWYRIQISPRVGQRCVFEPSCSRYSELAFRNHGFFRGAIATLGRLGRCRPRAGGLDLP